jgi:hypothetical protein
MLDWTGLTYDATPRPDRPSGCLFFNRGCMAGIALGMVTMCVVIFAMLQVLATFP